MAIDAPAAHGWFASEAAWPFRLRTEELDRCLEFLDHLPETARVLRISGESGAGKSFLVRELVVRQFKGSKNGVALYVDVPPGELEAAALFDKLDYLLSSRRTPSRDAPSMVGLRAARAWQAAKRGRSAKRLTYFYLVIRDVVSQIPPIGPFIKAVLPQTLPTKLGGGGDDPGVLRFLTKRSRSRRVLLAIDNVQFLSTAQREIISAELAAAGPHLRLVLIERVVNGEPLAWTPAVPDAHLMDLKLGRASLDDIVRLVAEVLPDDNAQELGAAIYRRSDGNLKSVWFQLRLIAARREDQGFPVSYEDVITTLPAIDQTVLRFIVFTIGGLTIANLVALFQASDLRLQAEAVTGAITDMAALGLLVINSETADRVRVEHELVAHVVSETTPEEDKLELHSQAVRALGVVLDAGATPTDEPVLFDRLLGIISAAELRRSASLLAHVVQFISAQRDLERHSYLASICRDSVCWDVLDCLPDTTVRALLDAIQKASLFAFGLVATVRLRSLSSRHEAVASLYEAKYLVQLFRYDEALAALERADESKEKNAVAFNILLNLARDDEAAGIASAVFADVSGLDGSEQDFLILRNSGHLFPPAEAAAIVECGLRGFEAQGRRFGAATASNNLGIVSLTSSLAEARRQFEHARRELEELGSPEVYQPMVNLSGTALLSRDYKRAERYLSAAREAAPRLLLQDRAMLDLNAVALDACAQRTSLPAMAERMAEIVAAARKTRDVRFIDLVVWFAGCIDAVRAGAPASTARSHGRIEVLRASPRTPLEIFVEVSINGLRLEVPFVLSPHWRY